MPSRNWKRFRPTSLRAAIEGCVDFARARHNRSVEQIADLCGISSKFTLYKYMESGKLPAVMIRPFEHACGCDYITRWLAYSAHKLVIDIPTGRKVSQAELMEVQVACNDAATALVNFHIGKAEAKPTLQKIGAAMEQLGYHHAQIEKHAQPELEFCA